MGLRKQLHRYLSPRAYLRGLVNRRSQLKVLGGPFEGMQYVSESCGSAFIPKVVGCYERELYGAIDQVIAGEHDLLVDVGAAEGYFAVGLATRCDAPVIAYEMNPAGRELAKRVAALNQVDHRLTMRGECDAAKLEETLTPATNPFLLIDVEGAEAEILDPATVPTLERTTVLVELHEFARPGITAELLRRFESTHQVETIWDEDRAAADYPFASFWTRLMPKRYLRRAVEEHRGVRQAWLWMTPRRDAEARSAA